MNKFAAQKLYGVIPALVTPRAADRDEPDLVRLAEVTRWLLDQGVHGIFACSSTGEAPLLSWKQRRLVCETVVETVGGRVPVLAGVGAASTSESLRLARDARQAGVTHLCVLPAHFAPVTQEELCDYLAAIADCTELPTLLYNFPGRTGGQTILPHTAALLARHHNIIGLKDSSGDLAYGMACLAACGSDFAFFTGSESLISPTLNVGGAGTICAGANVVPDVMVALYNAAAAGNSAMTMVLQAQLLPWREIVSCGTFPASVKAAMSLIGQPVGDPFLPVRPVSAEQRPILAKLLATMTGENA